MVGISNKEAPLRLLSLDGGGVRGVSELIILQQLMLNIQKYNRLPTIPKPCDVFDMIGGTSTGGLIAIMLGRLQMSVDQVLDEYTVLSKDVFGELKATLNGRFKATNLENAIRGMIQRYGEGDPNAKLFAPGNHCKAFVVSKDASNITGPAQLYRSYATGSPDDHLDVRICEAARATSAAPTFFKRQEIDHQGQTRELVDGAMGANNPTRLLIAEAQSVFPLSQGVSCIVSIGTGKKDISDVKAPSLFQRMVMPGIPFSAVRAMKDITTDCEAVSEELERRFYDTPNLYRRFNVERGLEKIGLDEYKQLGVIKSKTIQYLQEVLIEKKAEQASFSLLENAAANTTVEGLGF